eukprot:1391480-Amorphochlora_amoeboformis.AAC.1
MHTPIYRYTTGGHMVLLELGFIEVFSCADALESVTTTSRRRVWGKQSILRANPDAAPALPLITYQKDESKHAYRYARASRISVSSGQAVLHEGTSNPKLIYFAKKSKNPIKIAVSGDRHLE